MESPKIEQLLESYFEGTTSLEQEKVLRRYFTSNEVAPHLEAYVGMFSAFAKAQQETLPESVTLPTSKKPLKWLAGIAAASILAFSIVSQSGSQEHLSSTYEDPEVAILKTKQTLGMMSKIFEQSTSQLHTVKEFENTPALFLNQ